MAKVKMSPGSRPNSWLTMSVTSLMFEKKNPVAEKIPTASWVRRAVLWR